MASKTALDRYKSISRPSISKGFSSFASSLVKKTQAAEDAIIDNAYSEGSLSADAYQAELTKRLSRNLTPKQQVDLRQKITDVQVKLDDADIARRYSAGEITTDQVLSFEKMKLSRIPEPNSAAYQTQARRVQELQDRTEREARATFRVQENKRISEMPEDTSERMYEKYRLYERLENQARLDGDAQAADSFATSKSNYANSAKRAEINDLITNTRQSVSENMPGGLGLPSAEAGSTLYGQLTGSQASAIPGQAVATPTTSGGNAGVAARPGTTTRAGGVNVSSTAVNNALKGLDASQKRIERLQQDQTEKQQMLNTYDVALSRATGDQKTTLQIARNNLAASLAETGNSLEREFEGINDKIARIQELQAGAAKKSFSQEVRVNDAAFKKAENDLEKEFIRGKITKQEYIAKGVELAATKTDFYNQVSDGFSQFGEDLTADNYIQKAQAIQDIHERLSDVATNLDDYEPVAVRPGGKVSNLFGQGLKPGDFALTNVRQLKENGRWNSYFLRTPIRDDKGKIINYGFSQIEFPNEDTDIEGFPITARNAEDLAKLKGQAFIYTKDDKGKIKKEEVSFVKGKDQAGGSRTYPLLKRQADQQVKNGFLVNDPRQGLIVKPEQNRPPGQIQARLAEAGANITSAFQGKNETVNAINRAVQKAGGLPKFGKTVTVKDRYTGRDRKIFLPFQGEASAGVLKPVIDFAKQVGVGIGPTSQNNPVQGAINSAVRNVINTVGGVVNNKNTSSFVNSVIKNTQGLLGNLVPQAYARSQAAGEKGQKQQGANYGEVPNTPGWRDLVKQGEEIAKEYGIHPAVLIAQMALESGRGQSDRAQNTNNLFGYNVPSDESTGNIYDNPADSIREYAQLIATDPRYAIAMKYKNDPVRMIQEIKRAGYAADPDYVNKVINTPEFRTFAKATPTQTTLPQGKLPMTFEQFVQGERKKGSRLSDQQLRDLYNRAAADITTRQPAQVFNKAKTVAKILTTPTPKPKLPSAQLKPVSAPQMRGTAFKDSAVGKTVNNVIGPAVSNVAQNVARNVSQAVSNVFRPAQPALAQVRSTPTPAPRITAKAPVAAPRITTPAPKLNLVQQAIKTVAPVVQAVAKPVQQVVNTVSSFFGGLFAPKKKK